MEDKYDALMFYRTTYGDLSSNPTNYVKEKLAKKEKKQLAKKSNKELREQRQNNKRQNSESYYKRHSCTRKIFYSTEALAVKAIREQPHKSLTYYGCGFCGGFHLTTVRNEKI